MYELRNQYDAGTAFILPREIWHVLLRLGRLGRWNAASTLPPPGLAVLALALDADTIERTALVAVPWHGGYRHADGQRVDANDANALADALMRILDDVPDADLRFPFPLIPDEPSENILERVSGPKKRSLRVLIQFLRLGAFTIERHQ